MVQHCQPVCLNTEGPHMHPKKECPLSPLRLWNRRDHTKAEAGGAQRRLLGLPPTCCG